MKHTHTQTAAQTVGRAQNIRCSINISVIKKFSFNFVLENEYDTRYSIFCSFIFIFIFHSLALSFPISFAFLAFMLLANHIAYKCTPLKNQCSRILQRWLYWFELCVSLARKLMIIYTHTQQLPQFDANGCMWRAATTTAAVGIVATKHYENNDDNDNADEKRTK